MTVTIQFLGAAGTVTGSKYLIRHGDTQLLVDAGLFQGSREWREHNWDSPPCDLGRINAVLITHAHIDHTGLLPRYHKLGLRCPIYATNATQELSNLLLIDSAKLQEEETAYRAETGKTRHVPPLPLYVEEDARSCLSLFRGVRFDQRIEVARGVFATWTRIGHILGAASIRLEIGGKTIDFSGDIGRYSVPILCDPSPIAYHDLLLIESTYGDRLHGTDPAQDALAQVINETAARRGTVIIPSFAVGRTQDLLFYLRELKGAGRIPDIPIIVDSPMAQDATRIYGKHVDCYDEEAKHLFDSGNHPFSPPKLYFIRDRSESIRLNQIDDPMVLISASGMLTGGRILHHLKHRIHRPENTILFVGYQPPGGRGHWIKSGAAVVRLLGDEIPIRARIAEISGLSAHADRDELLRWCRSGSGKPGRVAIVHGEPGVAERFKASLESELSWNAFVAGYFQEITV